MNRTVVGNISLSLDGRVNGPGGDYDMGWIAPHAVTAGSLAHMIRVTSPATTALLGRKNYQGFGGYWPAVADDETAPEESRAFSRWLNETEKVVFSSTLDDAPWQNSRIAATDPVATVKELRQQDGGDIVVLASSSVIRTLLAAGELDRLSVTLCPELVGGGVSLFDETTAASSWSLTDCTRTESGALCLLYDRTA
ncbi:dihydrofolate reductase family protein [Kribbella sp.]|uniref:dihydrofolate reductase family protein n=1 Tax=Kribbella sp. TaxID=1871183 RepID=UPI002D2BE024|nr:dihydrofolate reductase family protein [Kribbella sp.]HZX08559.1 dihydrofolate reductase family protein [Kribbella sp.]